MALRMLKHVKAPKDKTVEAARIALVNEKGFQALPVEQQTQVLDIFNDEWGKVQGDVIKGVDVIEVPKRIHKRLIEEGITV